MSMSPAEVERELNRMSRPDCVSRESWKAIHHYGLKGSEFILVSTHPKYGACRSYTLEFAIQLVEAERAREAGRSRGCECANPLMCGHKLVSLHKFAVERQAIARHAYARVVCSEGHSADADQATKEWKDAAMRVRHVLKDYRQAHVVATVDHVPLVFEATDDGYTYTLAAIV